MIRLSRLRDVASLSVMLRQTMETALMKVNGISWGRCAPLKTLIREPRDGRSLTVAARNGQCAMTRRGFMLLCGPGRAIGAPLRSRLCMTVALGANAVAQGEMTFIFLCGRAVRSGMATRVSEIRLNSGPRL